MRPNHSKRPNFRKLPLFVAVAGCLYGSLVYAQDASEPQDEEQETEQSSPAPTELERMTVTGSLLRRLEYDSVSPVQVITADTSVNVGQIETAEFLQKSNVAAGSTQINHQFSGFVVEGGTGTQSLDLRGLGANRTLVLLNGKRPGPAGVRGQVGAFDLNVIPSSILQRIEIVKDGSSSLYGSDAVAGVVNLITRKNIDKPEITISGQLPFLGEGERFTVAGATGWNFDNGSVVLAGEYYLHKPLRMGDRDYLRCAEDRVWDENGNRIDRQDRSVTGGTRLGGCNNLYANTVIDYFDPTYRLVPTRDGSTIGALPGYRPRPFPTPSYANGGTAYYEDQLNFDFFGNAHLINRQERMSAYAASNFSLGSVNWNSEVLFNRRQTDTLGYRQFFPVVEAPVPSGFGQVIMPFSSRQDVTVDYGYITTGFDGLFSFTDTWAWQANASYSRSEGDYGVFSIVASRTGDLTLPDSGTAGIDYFRPCVLNGSCMSELEDAVGQWHTGNTVYDQFVVGGVVTGELFDLPAGAVGMALGVEYRDFSIDDQPSELELSGDIWGSSTAQPTKGDDNVKEIFAEFEVPILKGVPGFESLTANLSARAFDYDSVAESDHVWKAGLSWQIVPSVRIRGTKGTSYRAPGLYELYLGNLSGFLAQTAVDPCINWADPTQTNDFIRANCAAAGIPGDYAAAGASSAEIFQGGGAGVLTPENSTAKTIGVVFTPEWAPLSIALDYFSYDVRDQIGQLDAYTILAGCYASPVYPNEFCNLFERNPSTAAVPFAVTEIYQSYININRQLVRGYDLLTRYDNDFSFGSLELEAQVTYTKEDVSLLFEDPESGGLTRYNNVGYIGRPQLVGNFRAALKRDDWTYSYFLEYYDETENLDLSETFTYNGYQNARRDITAERAFYHTLSARYEQPNWSLLVGIENVLNTKPAMVSTGAATRYGNVPAFATQYDLYGRSLFARWNYKF